VCLAAPRGVTQGDRARIILDVSRLQGSSKVCQTIKIGIMTAIAATCQWCGQEFSSKAKREKHAKTCKPFACGQCEEEYKTKSALQEYTKTHRQQFRCDPCDAAPFKTSGPLEEHSAHVHEIPIKCSACDKIFKAPWVRDSHYEAQHSDNVKFGCPCGYKFHSGAKLRSHEETCVVSKRGATNAVKRRLEELSAATGDRTQACTQAFSEVRQAAKMRLECNCETCGLSLKNRDSLKRHIRKTHK
jgi:hypothetical protein